MSKLPTACNASGCTAVVTARYCDEHKAAAARQRRKRSERHSDPPTRLDRIVREFYGSKAWKAARKRQLAREPLCDCGAPATRVHHTVPVRENLDRRLDTSVLSSVCKSCHEREERRGFIRDEGSS